ncbi:hypothetical protein O6H91_11G100800 [Diphasiastrum complanatum]|nr:hypothetical protein O6H91_11G100800 [Diphasiastrum complanatum]
MSPEFKKRKEDNRSVAEFSSKQEKLPKSDRAGKAETQKFVNASEGKSKSQKSNLQPQNPGQQKETSGHDTKKREAPVQSQKKVGQVKPSPRKRKRQDELEASKSVQMAESESKSRKAAQTWAPKDELLLASQFLTNMKDGISFPLKKSDIYWEELRQRLQGRLETDWSKDQIYDKYRRMKSRYDVLKERLKSEDTKLHKYKGAEEEKLFKVYQQLWGKESRELKQRSEKPRQKSPTSFSEEEDEPADEEEAAAEERETHIATERNHIDDDEEETTEEEDEHVAEQSAPEPPSKKSKPRKVFPPQDLDQNGLDLGRHDTQPSNFKNALAKIQDPSDMTGTEEFQKALQNASLCLLEESQNKFLDIFKQEQAKTHAVIEKIVKEFDEKFRWLSQLVMASLPAGSIGTFLPRLLAGFSDSLYTEDNVVTSSFQQEWLEQQTQEVQVSIQRMQLMQDILRVRQEQLKRPSQ